MLYHLISTIKRNPSLTKEQFDKHWSEYHGNLFMQNPVAQQKVVKYSQTHFHDVSNSNFSAAGFEVPQDYDGIANFWFRSLDDANEVFDSKYYKEVVVPDEKKMLDRSKTTLVVTVDEDKWVDGRAPEGSHVHV